MEGGSSGGNKGEEEEKGGNCGAILVGAPLKWWILMPGQTSWTGMNADEVKGMQWTEGGKDSAWLHTYIHIHTFIHTYIYTYIQKTRGRVTAGLGKTIEVKKKSVNLYHISQCFANVLFRFARELCSLKINPSFTPSIFLVFFHFSLSLSLSHATPFTLPKFP